MEAQEIAEQARESNGTTGFIRTINPLLMLLAVVLLAFSNRGGDNADMDFLDHHIASSDDFNFQQARNTDISVKSSVKGMMEVLAPTMAAEQQTAAQKLMASLQSDIDYDKNNTIPGRDGSYPEGTGTTQLYAHAHEHIVQRDESKKRGDYFDYGSMYLELALAIGSIGMLIAGFKPTFGLVSIVLLVVMTFLGAVMMINGYNLFWDIPLEMDLPGIPFLRY